MARRGEEGVIERVDRTTRHMPCITLRPAPGSLCAARLPPAASTGHRTVDSDDHTWNCRPVPAPGAPPP